MFSYVVKATLENEVNGDWLTKMVIGCVKSLQENVFCINPLLHSVIYKGHLT